MPNLFNYRKFIQENFLVPDYTTQQPVPFIFANKPVQNVYYDQLMEDYPKGLEGVRELILKARREGFSALVLALFAVDFIRIPNSISICISHRRDMTELLFKLVRSYITSYCVKHGFNVKDYLKTDNKGLMESAINGATFYIGTAGAKVGGRGGMARNIHFSECAFYQDTELITAQEIVVATAQQVPPGKGMIFIESTANGVDNYYQKEWERANTIGRDGKPLSTYKARFYGWQVEYTKEAILEKRRDFPNDQMWKQEYPGDPDEAFIASGSPYFDNLILATMLEKAKQNKPIQVGRIYPDGQMG